MIDVAGEVPESLRKFSRAEYYALAATGAFDGERVELIGGFVVAMSPQNRRHALGVQRLTQWFVEHRHGLAVRPQLPLCLAADNEPEPDLALTDHAFETEHPSTAHLVIEVASSSLRLDRLKAALYAIAGVPEYWILNLEDDVVEVYRDPVGDAYRTREVVARGGCLAPRCLPGEQLSVDEILPDRR